jgi:hypothetical protein
MGLQNTNLNRRLVQAVVGAGYCLTFDCAICDQRLCLLQHHRRQPAFMNLR